MEEMGKETEFSIWVNWELRVVSFTEEMGFEKIIFPTNEDKLFFAVQKGKEGFGIQ